MAGGDLVLLAGGDPEGDDAPERGQGPQARRRRPRRRSSRARRRPARRRWPRGSPPEVVGARVDGRVGAEARRRARASPRSRRARSRAPPARLASCTASVPVPPPAACDDDRLARLEPRAAVDERVRGEALEQERRRRRRRRPRRGPGPATPRAPRPSRRSRRRRGAPPPGGRRRRARDLAAGDQRQRLLGEVVVAGRVRVGEVDPGPGDVDHDLPSPGSGSGSSTRSITSGPPNSSTLDRLASGAASLAGSPAHVPDRGRLDRLRLVRTPFGERERMLGGSAVHFALAAIFFTEVHVVGPVGDDFGERAPRAAARARHRRRRHRARRGRRDLLLARPLRPRPQRRPHRRHPAQRVRRLRAEALRRLAGQRKSLFLANIQPDLQRRVRSQSRAPASPRSTR